MIIEPAEAEAFLDYLDRRDLGAAIALALGLVDDGVPVPEVLHMMVAPAQAEVGARWQRNEYTVADEHAATAVADAVVSVLSAERIPVGEPVRMVVVCAEGEWHLLPARLLAESLRAQGFDVTFLGGSMPAVHLAAFLAHADVDIVGISCTTPLALEGALSGVEVAHDAGLPGLVGGRAFGTDDCRANAIGADLWAPDAQEAAELLREPLPTELAQPMADTGGAMEMALRREAWIDATMAELARQLPAFASYTPDQRARTREDIGYILRFAEAAVLTRDARLFDDFLVWLRSVLAARGVPPSVLADSLAILRRVTSGSALLSTLLAAVPHDAEA